MFGAGSLSHFGSVERCEGGGPGLVGRAIGLGPPGVSCVSGMSGRERDTGGLKVPGI